MNKSIERWQQWLLVALLLHLFVGAWFSVGYLTPDEHFQILEFLKFKLGGVSPSELAAEFRFEARPAIQVLLYWLVAKPLTLLGLENPFHLAYLLRAFSAFIAWVGLLGLVLTVKKSTPLLKTEAAKNWVAPLCALLWFLPAFHARTSQENLAGTLLLLGMCVPYLFQRRLKNKTLFLSSLLIGLSVEFRYQLIAPAAALWLYQVFSQEAFKQKKSGDKIVAATLGLVLAFSCGRLADFWGYGHWTFPFWNYFKYTFGKEALMTRSAWIPWDFYRSTTTESWPLLGIGTLILMSFVWIRHPFHPASLCTWPLFLFHSLISHKEFRFITPLGHFAPLMIPLAFESSERLRKVAQYTWLRRSVLAWNGLALVVSSCLPARTSLVILKDLWELHKNNSITRISVNEPHPYVVLGIPMHFYRPSGLVIDVESEFSLSKNPIRVYTGKSKTIPKGCRLWTQSPPEWVTDLLEDHLFQKLTFHRIPPDRISRTEILDCRSSDPLTSDIPLHTPELNRSKK